MTESSVLNRGADELVVMELPPGFRFHPTDEEIITHYLTPKVLNRSFTSMAIGDVDLNKCEPWDLPGKAKMGEKEWYFFCQKDRKYPTGTRTNRATVAGYWKATGKDKEIYMKGKQAALVGMKKTLVFYRGRAPKGEKTNWVIHEFRLEGMLPGHPNLHRAAKVEWAVCRVFHKSSGLKKTPLPALDEGTNSLGDTDPLLDSAALPPLMDPLYMRAGSSYAVENPSPMPSYFAAMMGLDHSPQDYSGLYAQMPPSASPCLHQDEAMVRALVAASEASAIRRHCKAEQYSNQSAASRSQDTGLSTDHNPEISSVISRHYEDLNGAMSSAGAVMDLDSMWKY